VVKHYTNEQIDRKRWDDCIDTAFNGCVYGYSWYLDIVCPGWEALVEDDYQSVFPLPFSQKLYIGYSMQPYFTQQLGVFSKTGLTADNVADFLSKIPDRFRFVDLNLNSFNKVIVGPWQVFPMVNYELDLIGDYERLKVDYSQNLKRNLKKATENGLTISKNIKPDEVVKLFRNSKGRQFRNLGDIQYSLLLRLVYPCIHKGMAQVWGAFDHHNELCAAVIWLFSHQKAVFLFSGLSEQGRNNGSMSFLIDTFIREHAGMQLTLDFEGSNDEGLARFYAGFGSKKTSYNRIVINRLPLCMKEALPVFRRLRNIFMG
jgi:hypothetical protein